MPVSYDGYDAKALQYAIEMIANSATVISLMGALDAAEVKSTYLIESRDTAPMDPPFVFASIEVEDDPDLVAVATWSHRGTVAVEILLAVTDGDTEAEKIRRAYANAGSIRSEIEAQFGGAGKLGRGKVRVDKPMLGDETSDRSGQVSLMLHIDWFTR